MKVRKSSNDIRNLLLILILAAGGLFAEAVSDSIKIVVLGSSTAEGTGVRNINNAWVNRFRTYLKGRWPDAQVINLAKGGYTTYHIMPDDYMAPNGRPGKDQDRNVTEAIGHHPTAVIINLPSNDAASGFSVAEQLRNYDTVCVHLAKAGIPVWIATTQPRTLGPEGVQIQRDMRDSTFARYGDHAIDFWYGLATEEGIIKTEYNSDNIHLNDEGHRVLFERVLYSGAGLPAFDVNLISPDTGGPFSTSIPIQWSAEIAMDPTREIWIFTSRDQGKNWQTLWSAMSNDTVFTWDISEYRDGLFNLLKVVMIGDSGFGMALTSRPFVIDNPVNSPPEVDLLAPHINEFLSGDVIIKWEAVDVESGNLTIDLEYGPGNNGFLPIVQNTANSGSYSWNTRYLPNSNQYKIKIRCFDGVHWGEDSLTGLAVQNPGEILQTITHIAGNGGGSVSARIVDGSAITGHEYQVSFDDSSFAWLVYNVDDLTSGERLVAHAAETDGFSEGPLFDGLRLLVKNYSETVTDEENSGWESGAPTLNISFSVPEIFTGVEILRGYPQPSDYRIVFCDTIVGYSSKAYGAVSVPLKFYVHNISDDRAVPVIFFDNDKDQTASKFDQIYFVEPDLSGKERMTWMMYLDGDDDAIAPAPGDVYLFRTLKPFTAADRFLLTTGDTGIGIEKILKAGEYALDQNYPNPFNPTTKIAYYLENPGFAVLDVYNLRGQKVLGLVHEFQKSGNHTVLLDASQLASGVYFYRLKVGWVSLTRKMVLLR
ncbi:MAG: SGNH/GDSL hydrolase family protein [Candidatus Marinimicrobia bacterium]|nr:SGNH/GDSL hydrolase family protein [Candidatus Neomarinimicrobiota bacterium]